MRIEILHGVGLACGVRRGLDDDVETGMFGHQQLGDALGMEHHARRPTVVGGRNGDADREFLILGVSGAGERHRRNRQAQHQFTHAISSQ